MTPATPISDIDATSPKVLVVDAAGTYHQFSAQVNLLLSRLPIHNAKVMPSFQHNLVGFDKLCKHVFKVLFDKTVVTVLSENDSILLKGWLEANVP